MIVRHQLDCQLAYRQIALEGGELVFSDLILFDPSFHVHIEKVYVHFNWKTLGGHITIDRPRLTVLKMKERSLQKGDESWTVTINDGTVEWGGLAHFSYDSNHLKLDWETSGVDLFFFEEGMEADLRTFDVSLLSPLFPYGEILDGYVTGRAAFDPDYEIASANLKMEEVAVATLGSSIEELEGAFSYNADLGGKWELKGKGINQGREAPFTCSGRGYFKRFWIESDIAFESGAKCRISGDEVWKFSCQELKSHEAALIQTAAALFHPSLNDWNLQGGIISANASISSKGWNFDFEGKDLLVVKDQTRILCEKATGRVNQDGGYASLTGKEYDLLVNGSFEKWDMELAAFGGRFRLSGGLENDAMNVQIHEGKWQGFTFKGFGRATTSAFQLNVNGDVLFLGKKIPFSIPNLSRNADGWAFDFRATRSTWDTLRLSGNYSSDLFSLNDKSHLLGSPLIFSQNELSTHLPENALLALLPLLQEWGFDLPKLSATDLKLHYANGQTKLDAHSPLFSLQFTHKEGSALGKASWKSFEVEFDGKVGPGVQCDLSLPKVRCNLNELEPRLDGIVEGQGHLVCNGTWEADFDLAPMTLLIQNQPFKNDGPIHFAYSSAKGLLFSGIDLHGPFDCIVDLLQYNANTSRLIFHKAHIHLPEKELNFTADLDVSSDFSSFACKMHEINLPLENLEFTWDKGFCNASFCYKNTSHKASFHMGDTISGRLTLGSLEPPLTIDFDYDKTLKVHSIEGLFQGLDASFHADSENTLIGSVRVDFTTLCPLLPPALAEVFQEIEMGKGYELKGRLKIDQNIPSFQGLLSGKQLELFGFQFRTLQAQVDLDPTHVHIYDLKISDSAGSMKIDDLLLETRNNAPWTIAIPTLAIQDLRPSLLQKPNEPPTPLTPLVVRSLTLTSFSGLLDESSTYKAEGNLHFINSYKREETVFDRPANMLSRIVGLDLELLIPTRGDLTFNLENSKFNLLSLTDAFSEGDRSEFFLETDPSPFLDLDGNLSIFIKMKQFVLLKFTESFLISVDGKLDDPKYHLQKRRFFGLM